LNKAIQGSSRAGIRLASVRLEAAGPEPVDGSATFSGAAHV
jgi:hypothetical protein